MRVRPCLCVFVCFLVCLTLCVFLLPFFGVCVGTERLCWVWAHTCVSVCVCFLSISFPVCLSVSTCLHQFMYVYLCLCVPSVRASKDIRVIVRVRQLIVLQYLAFKEMWYTWWRKSYNEPKCHHHIKAGCDSVEFLIEGFFHFPCCKSETCSWVLPSIFRHKLEFEHFVNLKTNIDLVVFRQS